MVQMQTFFSWPKQAKVVVTNTCAKSNAHVPSCPSFKTFVHSYQVSISMKVDVMVMFWKL
jgi:hypothetical protein